MSNLDPAQLFRLTGTNLRGAGRCTFILSYLSGLTNESDKPVINYVNQ